MEKEIRTVCYDDELKIEAYHFQGVVRPFPNHFHEYYVIGFVEKGRRYMSCRNREYTIGAGDLVLFSPGDSHACAQKAEGSFDYRGFHIPTEVMLELAKEVTGKRQLPGFLENVIRDEEMAEYLLLLHRMVMDGNTVFLKEETWILFISLLLERYGQPFENCVPECREEIERACAFLQKHFTERIYLEQICEIAGLSKSTLLRAFTKEKGVTPYRYLETIRINEAKKLLEQGAAPIEAAMETGFSDQSHFANFFRAFIGLSPGAYRNIFLRAGREENMKEHLEET